LRILNVASNQLVQLPPHEFWSTFTKLAVLDISHNNIAQWKDMAGLEQADRAPLVLLRMQGNPVAALPTYRVVAANRV
jgi:hypothetical protein